jgi:hypothetical protein
MSDEPLPLVILAHQDKHRPALMSALQFYSFDEAEEWLVAKLRFVAGARAEHA